MTAGEQQIIFVTTGNNTLSLWQQGTTHYLCDSRKQHIIFVTTWKQNIIFVTTGGQNNIFVPTREQHTVFATTGNNTLSLWQQGDNTRSLWQQGTTHYVTTLQGVAFNTLGLPSWVGFNLPNSHLFLYYKHIGSSTSNWILMSCQPHRVTSGQNI